MKGYDLFLKKLDMLDYINSKEIIRKIFGLERVILYTVDLEDGKIFFRVYDGNRYYKFIFSFEDMVDGKVFKIVVKEIYVYCKIYVYNFNDRNDVFSSFIKIIKEDDISYFNSFL